MKTNSRLSRVLAIAMFSLFLVGIPFAVVGSSESSAATAPVPGARDTVQMQPAALESPDRTHALNPVPPQETPRLVFIHHSCGGYWLMSSGGRLRRTLNENNYFVLDVSRGWGPPDEDVGSGNIGDHTSIGHWYNWFAGPHRDTYLSALYATDNNSDLNRDVTDPGGENEIIMFKSCYPNSNLRGNPDDPPTVGDNPLRGLSSSSPHHTVGNAKGIYNDILEYFRTRQDKLFVVITAPPLLEDTYADNARAFNNWLVHDWLADYPYHNVAVFDYYNVLTTNGGDADTNDFGLSTGNHHRAITTTTPITVEHITDGDDDDSPNTSEYPTYGGTNPHPSAAGNEKATGEFVPLLNIYYNCWRHGDCWDDETGWISVTAVTNVSSVYPGDTATYTLSLTASEGFTAPVTLTLEGAPADALVSFVPNPVVLSGTSQLPTTLYITTTPACIADTYLMTVTGTSDHLADTASVSLTVEPAAIDPTLSLSAWPTADAVVPGGTAAYTLSVNASEGFTHPVTFTLEGAPSGAVTSFDPGAVTPPGTSRLRITATPPITAGLYAMTTTAASGTLTDTVGLTLIVATESPSFTLGISPTARTAKPNQVVSYTVAISGLHGFSQPVSLTVVGLSTSVDTAWSVNPVTPGSSSTLTLSVPSKPPFGSHQLQVVGLANTQVVAEDIGLTIEYPYHVYLPLILSGICFPLISKRRRLQ